MIIRIHKIGKTKFGNYACFNARITEGYCIQGIANYDDDNLQLVENKDYQDLILIENLYKDKLRYKIIRNQ